MTRWYGMCNDRASAAFKSFDPSRFMVYFIDEGDPESRTAEELNAWAERARRTFDDDRQIVAVMQGSFEYCDRYLKSLDPMFEAVVVTGPKPMLERLGLKLLDGDWKPGDRQIQMDEVMSLPDEDAEARRAVR